MGEFGVIPKPRHCEDCEAGRSNPVEGRIPTRHLPLTTYYLLLTT